MAIFLPRFAQELSPFGHCGRQDFVPFSRYFDELDRAVTGALKEQLSSKSASLPRFNPRFDVQETDEAYHLTGELPGIDQKDITIQFTDEHTLSISGRTEHTREHGTRPGTVAAAPQQKSVEDNKTPNSTDTTDAVSETASEHSYQKPSVEDDDLEVIEKPTAETDNTSTTSTSAAAAAEASQVAAPQAQANAEQQPQSQLQTRYWLSERSVGQFARSFSFTRRIDQDSVKASLKNGVLSVVVPKAKVVAPRQIVVE